MESLDSVWDIHRGSSYEELIGWSLIFASVPCYDNLGNAQLNAPVQKCLLSANAKIWTPGG